MNFVKKLNLHWFCTQNHLFEPFSVRRACTKSYVSSEPYPRVSQIWCQNVRETWKKKFIKCRGESFARCRVIAWNVEGGLLGPPPSLFRVNIAWWVLKVWVTNTQCSSIIVCFYVSFLWLVIRMDLIIYSRNMDFEIHKHNFYNLKYIRKYKCSCDFHL